MMKSFYILLFTTLICAASCRAPKGDPGPAGAAGIAGTDGANGTDGESTLDKQGFIMGTLAYVDYKDSALSLPFNYEYTESLGNSEYSTYYDGSTFYLDVLLSRRDIADKEKFYTISFEASIDENGVYQAPTSAYVDFSYLANINNSLFQFKAPYQKDGSTRLYIGGESSTIEFTNFKMDTLTGRLTTGYTITYVPSEINYDFRYNLSTPATVTGSIDVVLNRKRYSDVPLTFDPGNNDE